MLTHMNLMNYEEYLESAKSEEIIFINELYDQGQILNVGLREIMNIDKHVRILVITSTMCKDSATIIPFLIKLSQFNKKIKVEFLLRNDNEELLKNICGEKNIPAILVLDENDNVDRKFIEFPKEVKELLIKNPAEKTKEIINEMRSGKYNQFIQEDLIRLITGKDYEYISFKRLDK